MITDKNRTANEIEIEIQISLEQIGENTGKIRARKPGQFYTAFGCWARF